MAVIFSSYYEQPQHDLPEAELQRSVGTANVQPCLCSSMHYLLYLNGVATSPFFCFTSFSLHKHRCVLLLSIWGD